MIERLTVSAMLLGLTMLPASAGESTLERDRAAILAMAGTYTITFDFQEVVAVQPGYELRPPYHATGDVELVEVLASEPARIELQHLLLADGHVVKHWRQEWLYENRDLYEFAGSGTFRHRRLDAEEVKGTWTQRVFQVDDSPRYQGFGRWTHAGGLSAWESNWAWRPLPRRESTKRSDYDVLVGRNRHTLTHTGWVHEQDNFKLVLRDGKELVLARETGLNRYDHVDPSKADAARGYWARTHAFWAAVRETWDTILVPGASFRLKSKVDDMRLWESISELADDPAAVTGPERNRQIRAKIDAYLESDPAAQNPEGALRPVSRR